MTVFKPGIRGFGIMFRRVPALRSPFRGEEVEAARIELASLTFAISSLYTLSLFFSVPIKLE